MFSNEKINGEDLLTRPWAVCLGAVLCCLLWGSAFPMIKIGYRLFGIASADAASQILFAGCRFTLAGILALIMGSIGRRRILRPAAGLLPNIFLLCLLQTVLQYLFFYIGLAHTTGLKASIIGGVNTFISILVASLIFRQEKLSGAKILGCLFGFAGVVLVNLSGMDLQFGLTGEGFILISTVAAAFSSVYLKRLSAREDPVTLSGSQFVMGGLIMIAAGLAMGGRLTFGSPACYGVLAYLGFLSAAAYSVWGILLAHNPVSKVTVYFCMNPIFGVILSALLLGEQQTSSPAACLAALALVCLGIYIVNRPR